MKQCACKCRKCGGKWARFVDLALPWAVSWCPWCGAGAPIELEV